MAKPVNQHCASCIGTLSFPMGHFVTDDTRVPQPVTTRLTNLNNCLHAYCAHSRLDFDPLLYFSYTSELA